MPKSSQNQNIHRILVRYGEVALKKGNRVKFEKRLIKNVEKQLETHNLKYNLVKRISGRLIVETDEENACNALSKVFGVTSVSNCIEIGSDIESIKNASVELVNRLKPKNFRISSRRLEKIGDKTSQTINVEVGAYVVEKTGCKVKLKDAELEIGIDILTKNAYIHYDRTDGVGGLPVGVSSKVLVLFSGGIDSGVAAYLCMKRGCEVTLIHFLHSDDVNTVPEKFTRIVKQLRTYHHKIRFLCVPSSGLEREILMNIPSKYRIIILRRLFLRISERLAEKMGCGAIATGDNIGQVASQTIENMNSISAKTKTLLIRPLICFDKHEIIDLAKKIGLFEFSCENYTDCCSFLVSKHPATHSTPEIIDSLEDLIDETQTDEAYEQTVELRAKSGSMK